MEIRTEDRQIVQVGDRVFNYYDQKWCVIITPPDDQGWFTVQEDNGDRRFLNGQRISTYKPQWAK